MRQHARIDDISTPEVKVDFFAALFAARTDIYATRWENARTCKAGWLRRCVWWVVQGRPDEDRD